MSRTTKILLAVGGIIVLSYPGMAWVTGMVIAGRIQHAEQQALDQVPYLTLVRRDYHRGVYRSTEVATYGFHIPVPQALKTAGGAAVPPSATITVTSDIQHGPLPGLHALALASVDSTITAPPALQQALSTALGSQPLLRIHSIVGFLGGTTLNMTSPAFSLKLPDGSTVAWGGLTASGTTAGGQGRWSAQLSAPRFAFDGAQGRFELTGVEYSGTNEQAFDGIYLGNGTFTIERVAGSTPRSGDYSLQRISVTSTSKPNGEFFDMRVDVAMDAAQVAAVQLKNVMYSQSVEHIHGPSFAAMAKAMRTAEHQAGADPAQVQAALRGAMSQYGTDMLLQNPVLDIRQVSFAMPEGSFLLSARISAPGLSRADLQWPATILALKTHALVTADLKVDNGLVQKLLSMGGSNPNIAARLNSFEQQGYLTAGPAAVTTHLELSGGRLTLNGHPFPPATPVN